MGLKTVASLTHIGGSVDEKSMISTTPGRPEELRMEKGKTEKFAGVNQVRYWPALASSIFAST